MAALFYIKRRHDRHLEIMTSCLPPMDCLHGQYILHAYKHTIIIIIIIIVTHHHHIPMMTFK